MPEHINDFIERKLKEQKAIEAKHIKHSKDLLISAKYQLKEQLDQDPTKFQKFQYGVRLKEIDNIYNELELKLKDVNNRVTKDGIQLGLFETVEYSGLASESKKFTKDLVVSLAPKINKNAITNLSKTFFDYQAGKIKQSKYLSVNQAMIVKNQIGLGMIKGKGEKDIIRNALKSIDANFKGVEGAVQRHVHHTLNNVYNETKLQSTYELAQDDPEIGLIWISRLHHSTPICLELHGQTIKINEVFEYSGGWTGTRPPAVGAGADPSWHPCYSTVAPNNEAWPNNVVILNQRKAIKMGVISGDTERLDSIKQGRKKAS